MREFLFKFGRLWMCLLGIVGLAVLLNGCAGTYYGGTNYVAVDTGSEKWKVVGAKDENNVSFSVETKPDGSRTVMYSAESSDASTVIGKLAEQNAALVRMLLQTARPTP